MNIDITGLDKAEVLLALYNNAKPTGNGVIIDFIQYTKHSSLSYQECVELLKTNSYFDYLYGRVIKVDLSEDTFDPRLYDRDNGNNAAQHTLNQLMKRKVTL